MNKTQTIHSSIQDTDGKSLIWMPNLTTPEDFIIASSSAQPTTDSVKSDTFMCFMIL